MKASDVRKMRELEMQNIELRKMNAEISIQNREMKKSDRRNIVTPQGKTAILAGTHFLYR